MRFSRRLAIVLLAVLIVTSFCCLYIYANTAFWWTLALAVIITGMVIVGRAVLGIIGLVWFALIVLDALDKRRR